MHDTRAISVYYHSNILFHRRTDAPIASTKSREAILDLLLKDTSTFHGVPYKEFNSDDSSNDGGTYLKRHFALVGSLIRLTRKCSAIEEIQESPLQFSLFEYHSIVIEEVAVPISLWFLSFHLIIERLILFSSNDRYCWENISRQLYHRKKTRDRIWLYKIVFGLNIKWFKISK